MNRNGLNACTEISTIVGCFPGAGYDLVTGTAPRSNNIGVGDHRRRIAIIGRSRCTCVGRCDWILTVYSNIHRTGDYRGSDIVNRNGLNAGTEITTVIGGLPGTCYKMVSVTASWNIHISISDHRGRVAVIRGRRCSCVSRCDRILAINGNIHRAGYHRRCDIMKGNGLDTGAEITAVVCGLPCPCNHMITCAASRCVHIGISDYRRSITIICSGGSPCVCRQW